MTHLFWVAQHNMAHSFIRLCKPLHNTKAVTPEGDLYHIGQYLENQLRFAGQTENMSVHSQKT